MVLTCSLAKQQGPNPCSAWMQVFKCSLLLQSWRVGMYLKMWFKLYSFSLWLHPYYYVLNGILKPNQSPSTQALKLHISIHIYPYQHTWKRISCDHSCGTLPSLLLVESKPIRKQMRVIVSKGLSSPIHTTTLEPYCQYQPYHDYSTTLSIWLHPAIIKAHKTCKWNRNFTTNKENGEEMCSRKIKCLPNLRCYTPFSN